MILPDAAPPADPITELAIYLNTIGEPFRQEYCGGKDEIVDKELNEFFEQGKTIDDFYRESWTYPYHLTFFAEDIWKKPYRRIIWETLPPPLKVLEYGCGVGADGLKFIDRGYDVSFADYPSRCTEYLKWRLAWRRKFDLWHDVPFYELPDAPRDFDLVFAFDVIEHVRQPKELLEEIEGYGKMVAVNIFRHMHMLPEDKPRLHYWYDGEELKDWILSRKEIVTLRDCDYAYFIIYRR